MGNKVREMTIYHANNQLETKSFVGQPELAEMQEVVGGFIAYVQLPRGNNHKKMVVNEEGLLMGLPVNRKASLIANQTIVRTALVY